MYSNIDINSQSSYHNMIEIEFISQVSDIIKNLIINDKKILLVCDIDSTLIHSDVSVGSDSWFFTSLKNDNLNDVRNKLCLLYSLLEFKGVENNETDDFVKLIYEFSNPIKYTKALKYLCLTARNTTVHSNTIKHFKDAGYEKIFVRPNMLTIENPLYLIKNDSDTNYPCVRYIDNICSCSGENKGDVLIEILKQYYNDINNEYFDMILFVDDSVSNIKKVHEKLKYFISSFSHQEESLCIHYKYMEERKSNYTTNNFIKDTQKVNELMDFKQYINTVNF